MYKVAESILKNGRSLEADKELIKIKNILELIPEQNKFMKDFNMKNKKFVNKKNKKIVFTPGPGSLLEENIIGLAPYFGRGM